MSKTEQPEAYNKPYTLVSEVDKKTPITEDGYALVEEAAKYRSVPLETIEKKIKTKLKESGLSPDTFFAFTNATVAAFNSIKESKYGNNTDNRYYYNGLADQLELLVIAISLTYPFEIYGESLETFFALFQIYLCKLANVELKGIQPFGDYFFDET